jgi:hypothetical protein
MPEVVMRRPTGMKKVDSPSLVDLSVHIMFADYMQFYDVNEGF